MADLGAPSRGRCTRIPQSERQPVPLPGGSAPPQPLSSNRPAAELEWEQFNRRHPPESAEVLAGTDAAREDLPDECRCSHCLVGEPHPWRYPVAAVCHGYINCCRCPRCLKRQETARKYGYDADGKLVDPHKPARQPWEIAA